MEPAARLTLREQRLAWAEELPHSTSREGLQLLTRKVGKERGLFENGGQISAMAWSQENSTGATLVTAERKIKGFH